MFTCKGSLACLIGQHFTDRVFEHGRQPCVVEEKGQPFVRQFARRFSNPFASNISGRRHVGCLGGLYRERA
ncbi:hypothetical protein AORI_4568 [Amycolatopsis keratiniphila]|uniref:Uncharacterized protein n=1 Tax=Amycolatopsis keratiniphila TaxID=129921 RepID=R4T866_9PSEU|nr:hypothetical protein AORI_4568 [Amycolatopsis keratiniphila]